ncbi:MAG: hypothetical protein L0G99_06155 [Propionibacteriales bacterium]|nr:hypothetical protein [Propionibacteriales bacterium]
MFTRIVLLVAAALLIIGGATTIMLGLAARSDQVTCDGQPMVAGDLCQVERSGGTLVRDLGQQADAQATLPTIGPWVGAGFLLLGLAAGGLAIVVRRTLRPAGPQLPPHAALPNQASSPEQGAGMQEQQWWEIQQEQQRHGPWGRPAGDPPRRDDGRS